MIIIIKHLALAFISIASSLTISQPKGITDTFALLSPPAIWDYSYKREGANWRVGVRSPTGVITVDTVVPSYLRTTDTVNFRYFTDMRENIGGFWVNSSWPFPTTIDFRVSNSSWVQQAGSYYRPTSTSIGTNANTTGIFKIQMYFNNTTEHNYQLMVDNSINSGVRVITPVYQSTATFAAPNQSFANNSLNNMIIPAGTGLTISYISSSLNMYLDALYLRRLNTPATPTIIQNAYDAGYNAGIDDANKISQQTLGIVSVFTGIFTAMSTIFSITVLPNITLGTLVAMPLIFMLLLFVLKMLRGGG